MDERPNAYRIVVGVGFTPACELAVRDALQLATRIPGAEVHATTVLAHEHIQRPSGVARGYSHLSDAEQRLEAFVGEVVATSPLAAASPPIVYHVRLGEVALALTQVAFDVDASLIIVGSRSTSRARKLLGAPVSERLIRHGRYSVMIVKRQDTTGLVKTPSPDPRRPGEDLTSSREEVLQSAARVDYTLPRVHIAGNI